ncbi:hypothetical protein VPNG_09066 [Cytospora leucostoma]|uniref:Uncharacterized protein n=1 Tax=Cytospora leucostoma TaxID=1230097 RepID=A0A423VZ82_9PEZI|nr:hypothetical protein VPNG_09066 [Cytospora leucostoma]
MSYILLSVSGSNEEDGSTHKRAGQREKLRLAYRERGQGRERPGEYLLLLLCPRAVINGDGVGGGGGGSIMAITIRLSLAADEMPPQTRPPQRRDEHGRARAQLRVQVEPQARLREEEGLLGDGDESPLPDRRPRQRADVDAVDRDGPLGGVEQAEEGEDDRGLAAPRPAAQDGRLPRLDRQVYTPQGDRGRAVLRRHAGELDEPPRGPAAVRERALPPGLLVTFILLLLGRVLLDLLQPSDGAERDLQVGPRGDQAQERGVGHEDHVQRDADLAARGPAAGAHGERDAGDGDPGDEQAEEEVGGPLGAVERAARHGLGGGARPAEGAEGGGALGGLEEGGGDGGAGPELEEPELPRGAEVGPLDGVDGGGGRGEGEGELGLGGGEEGRLGGELEDLHAEGLGRLGQLLVDQLDVLAEEVEGGAGVAAGEVEERGGRDGLQEPAVEGQARRRGYPEGGGAAVAAFVLGAVAASVQSLSQYEGMLLKKAQRAVQRTMARTLPSPAEVK